MRLIDADALKTICEKLSENLRGKGEGSIFDFCKIAADGVDGAIIRIDRAPTIDAVEVVRCKDCIHYESDGGAMMICNITDMVEDDDDYCSYGERSE